MLALQAMTISSSLTSGLTPYHGKACVNMSVYTLRGKVLTWNKSVTVACTLLQV